MESEEDYNQDRINLLKIVVDTGNDYPEYDNSSEDFSISSIDSSSNDMDADEVPENHEDIEDQDHHLKIKWKLYWFSWGRTWIKFKFKE